METDRKLKIIISGGGTGGHVFPAIAIAKAVREQRPDTEILFVGAKGKMEMEKVPAAGFEIVGLPVVGIQRKQIWKNFLFPCKLLSSFFKTRKLIKNYKPDVVVGVGGYASGPSLMVATMLHIPTLIQEQNSFPGLTNRILSKGAKSICVDYDKMDEYFPRNKIIQTGNPIRQDILDLEEKKAEAEAFFGFKKTGKVIFVMGGSLGARTINESIFAALADIQALGCTLIWQTGKYYYEAILPKVKGMPNLILLNFVSRMDYAYALADIIVSRAGAISISELCVVGKPCVLIPSPNVADDHQTKNALALSSKNAAVLLNDEDAVKDLGIVLTELLNNENRQVLLARNIQTLAKVDAANKIAKEIFKIVK